MDRRSNGDGGPWSRYRREHTTPGSDYSSSSGYTSGTIVSTAYTPNSSRLSSFSTEAAIQIQLDMVEVDEDRSSWIETEKNDTEFVPPKETEKKDAEFDRPIRKPYKETDKKDTEFDLPIKKPHKETEMKHTEVFHVFEMSLREIHQLSKYKLVQNLMVEFFSAPTANRGVVEAWLEHLGVGWVIHIADGASTWKVSHTQRSGSWVRALHRINQTMHLMVRLFPSIGELCMSSIYEEEEPMIEYANIASVPSQLHYAQFIRQTMFKMLAFVDVIVGPNTETTVGNLRVLLDVHWALSGALPKIRLPIDSALQQGVESIQDELISLLSANLNKTSAAIWSTMEQINKTAFLESIEDREHSSSSSLIVITPGPSDIHMATRSVQEYIILLEECYFDETPILPIIVSEVVNCGMYVPQIRDVPPLISMMIEVAYCLEEKLAKRSESSFLDHSSRFLFLLNNLYYIRGTLDLFCQDPPAEVHVAAFTRKVDAYIESYVQVSWEPLFSCLLNPTPLRKKLGRASPLKKFEFAFQKTYTTQKHWKVLNPYLRQRLRISIVEKNIPIYAKYIEDTKVTHPKFTLEELEEMLQDLFEG